MWSLRTQCWTVGNSHEKMNLCCKKIWIDKTLLILKSKDTGYSFYSACDPWKYVFHAKKDQWNVGQNTYYPMPRMCFLSNALVKLKSACMLHSLRRSHFGIFRISFLFLRQLSGALLYLLTILRGNTFPHLPKNTMPKCRFQAANFEVNGIF